MARPAIYVPRNPRAVEEILGQDTLRVLNAPDRVECFIVERPQESNRCGIEAYQVLAQGPDLSTEQIGLLRRMVLDPLAHYDGRPVFRRYPSVPGFAFQLFRGELTLDMLIDLHNPGWEFYCEKERHENWHWVGDEMASLAKSLFPDHASPRSRSIWKQGAMKKLAAIATATRSTQRIDGVGDQGTHAETSGKP